jgi:hypothetical protein
VGWFHLAMNTIQRIFGYCKSGSFLDKLCDYQILKKVLYSVQLLSYKSITVTNNEMEGPAHRTIHSSNEQNIPVRSKNEMKIFELIANKEERKQKKSVVVTKGFGRFYPSCAP